MQVTQTYARPSTGTMEREGMRLDVPAEEGRPSVHLDAIVKDSLAYARAMLALYDVVSGDYRPVRKDHAAYQEWVQQRYLEELPAAIGGRATKIPALLQRREEFSARVAELQREVARLEEVAGQKVFWKSKYRYFQWLWDHAKEAWMVLDPVVSVHPDCLIFEVFSVDESSYGRVTVPTERLEILGDVQFGTTNIDFSRSLADEIRRVRSYRRAWLQIGGEGVTLTTGAGEAVEKKIDLPPSWVRGFLQVQSASAFPATEVTLSASTLAEILSVLKRHREDQGPRSLRFILAPGEHPAILVEPWGIEIRESQHVFQGSAASEIRIWGRRRLFSLQSLLPYADSVRVRLMGTGMPSYWTVFQKDHRFDLGLSGWTKNDWAQSARFDLLSTTTTIGDNEVARAAGALQEQLLLSPERLASDTGLPRDRATAALQRLCAEGRAMYDPAAGGYRWRPLFPFPVKMDSDEDKRLASARRILGLNGVKWRGPADEDEESSGRRKRVEDAVRLRAFVKGEKQYEVTLDVDPDGRVEFAECTCGWFRRERLRKGPCAHILAASALASKEVAFRVSERKKAAAVDLFTGKTFVFTGALTLFTRDRAEALVKERGGAASGSISRNTSYLIAGDKAGSKLKKAQDLGVPVLTEEEFRAMLEGNG